LKLRLRALQDLSSCICTAWRGSSR